MDETRVARIIQQVAANFETLGGGRTVYGNPISEITKNDPPTFVTGVSVEDVVRFVLEKAGG